MITGYRSDSMSRPIKEGFVRISSIASAFGNYGAIPKGILDKASCRGSQVHRLIKSYTNSIIISDDELMFMDQSLAGYFASFKIFWEEYEGSKIVLQEERIDDPELMITGEPDLVVEHKGRLVLIDWKCTYIISASWRLQAEGYNYLLHNVKNLAIDQIYFVRLSKEGEAPEVISFIPNWDIFLKAYELYNLFMKDQKCNLENE